MIKKIMFILMNFMFILSFSEEDKRTVIGAFNVLRLGRNKKDYEDLSKAIEPFDVIGLVEVMNRKGLHKLLSEVEKNSDSKWGYNISPYPVGTKKHKEYYAFLYKKDKVKVVQSEGFYPDKRDEFIREPYAVTFKINNFDFTYVLIHSIYGKKASDRQYEAMKILDVYEYFQDSDPIENDIIIGGDFNLAANNSAFENLLNHKDKITYTLDTSIKTTIGTKGFANSYDNIFLSKIYTTEFKGESGVIDITRGNYLRTRKEVSDHLPIYIIVDTEIDDD